jgi:hypothetical protein
MMTGGASESEISAINKPAGGWSPARQMDWGSRFVLAVTMLAGLFMTAAGVAALLAPSWFADAAGFPRHTHFVHDAGAFQLGIGVTLLLALAWRDGLALVLAGFLVAKPPMPSTTLSTLTWAATAATAGGWPPCRC